MKTYITKVFSDLSRFSDKLEDLSNITNRHWLMLSDTRDKIVYIFRTSGELLHSVNGKISKGKWEHVGNKSLLIEVGEESYLYRHAFVDDTILALRIDSKTEYAVFVDEAKFGENIYTLERIISFLERRYLAPNSHLNMKDENISSYLKNTEHEENPNFMTVVVMCVLFIAVFIAAILLANQSNN